MCPYCYISAELRSTQTYVEVAAVHEIIQTPCKEAHAKIYQKALVIKHTGVIGATKSRSPYEFQSVTRQRAKPVVGSHACCSKTLQWQAAAGRMLYDTTGMDRGGIEEGGSAAMLEGTQLCCTCQLRDILHCLGGVSVLLPLLSQLGEYIKHWT